MASTITHKRSAIAGKVPTVAQLALGEIAINTRDGKIYIKRDNGTESVLEIGATGPQGPEGPPGPQGLAGVTTATINYNTTANTVGSYGYFYTTQRAPHVAYGSMYYYPGTDVAGSYLRWASENAYYNAPSGTWRCMGYSMEYKNGNREITSYGYRTLFVRIS
jgi:hypothetical protein